MPAARRPAASAAAGARPDPFSAVCRPSAASQMSQNASPPIPQPLGMTTPSTAFVAIAASTADPPARSTPSPAAVARWWGATTAPCGRGQAARARAAGRATSVFIEPESTSAPVFKGRATPDSDMAAAAGIRARYA